MPVAKHRPNLAEVIAIAAHNRVKVTQKRRERLGTVVGVIINKKNKQHKKKLKGLREALKKFRTPSISPIEGSPDEQPHYKHALSGNYENDSDAENEESAKLGIELNLLHYWSSIFHSLLENVYMRVLLMITSVLAFAVLTYNAFPQGDALSDTIFRVMDWFVNSYFLLDGILKLLSFHAHLLVLRRRYRTQVTKTHIFKRCGIVDIIIATLCIILGDSKAGNWIRLFRVLLISLFALEEMPHIEVLMSGISAGLRSVLSTWLLLTIVYFVYAACTLTMFGENDPFHFSTLAISMFTLFQIATFDDWSNIMRLNMEGCDHYPSDYKMPYEVNDTIVSNDFGSFALAVCTNPSKQPFASSILFISFAVICGFILISLTVAAVTSGISEKLDSIKVDEDMDDIPPTPAGGGLRSSLSMKNLQKKTLISDPEMVLMMVKQVWKERSTQQAPTNSKSMKTIYSEGSMESNKISAVESYDRADSTVSATKCQWFQNIFDIRTVSLNMRSLTQHSFYKFYDAALIVLAALLQIYALQNPDVKESLNYVQIPLQFLFTVDIICKILAHYPDTISFFHDKWNLFDFLLVFATWFTFVPHQSRSSQRNIELLRVLRIIRLIKILSWVHDVNIMLRAISSSIKCMVHVIMITFVFFYHFGIAGVLLFAENDPYHFQDLVKALLTLFQISTMDDWIIMARINMMGCDSFGYDTGEEYYDSLCVHPKGLGWLAAWYFVIFIIIAVYVLVSLFLGIIITSMELLKEGIKEEAEVWKRVKDKQGQYNMTLSMVENLLEIFDLIDTGQNGKLTLNELKPLLTLVCNNETEMFTLFLRVDKDNSGQIDFAEFLDLVIYMKDVYKANKGKRLKAFTIESGMSNVQQKHKKGMISTLYNSFTQGNKHNTHPQNYVITDESGKRREREDNMPRDSEYSNASIKDVNDDLSNLMESDHHAVVNALSFESKMTDTPNGSAINLNHHYTVARMCSDESQLEGLNNVIRTVLESKDSSVGAADKLKYMQSHT